jgi:rhamnosyltransferase
MLLTVKDMTGERGFYDDYAFYIAGPIAKNWSEVIEHARDALINPEKFEGLRSEKNKIFNKSCDGMSSMKICEYLKTQINFPTHEKGTLTGLTKMIISQKLSKNNICAIVVTHNPEGDFVGRVARIVEQVSCVVIVDNNSNSHIVSMLKGMSSQQNIYLILNDENLGVATALNKGVQWAKGHEYQWVVTFDQDTIVMDYMIEELLKAYYDCRQKDKIAAVGSIYCSPNVGKINLAFDLRVKQLYVEVKTIITSGSLMPLAAFDVVGLFRDEFFIDFVDIEFCLRARAKGLKIILACKPVMWHDIGLTAMHRLPWKITGTSNHIPIRRYYMMRNNIITAKEYFLIDPTLIIALIYSRLKSTILMCLFEKNRLLKLKYSVWGLLDGLLGKFNRIIIK